MHFNNMFTISTVQFNRERKRREQQPKKTTNFWSYGNATVL